MSRSTSLRIAAFLLGLAASQAESPKVVVKTQGFLPFSDAPIHYRRSATLGDQITHLNRQLDRGERQLVYEPTHGYLKSVLQNLGIPESSQTMVYSKTSLQFQNISPHSPRALYFNDNVYVGQVRNSRSLELIAFDSMQGAVFYVLSEHETAKPRFERAQMDCVQCHIAAATRRIPGVMVRSVLTSPAGNPKGGAPIHTMGHETPWQNRFGGWFITGKQVPPGHMGNLHNGEVGAPLQTLSAALDARHWLHPHSDVVAHLVLAHQTQMHNLVTELNYRYRLALHSEQLRHPDISVNPASLPDTVKKQFEPVAEATLRYLLFEGEAKLPAPVEGLSGFTKDFTAIGPRDRKGRSLRDFDLETRIFRHRLSYLIYSDAFDAIPEPPRQYLLNRLFEVLSGQDQSPEFAHLTPEERRTILEILVDTKPGLPDHWAVHLGHHATRHPVSSVPTPAALRARP